MVEGLVGLISSMISVFGWAYDVLCHLATLPKTMEKYQMLPTGSVLQVGRQIAFGDGKKIQPGNKLRQELEGKKVGKRIYPGAPS